MRILDTIFEIFFPSRCLGCGAPGTELCLACLNLCPSPERESPAWIFPLYDYRDPLVKKSLWLLKYKGRRRLAGIFAQALYETMAEELSDLRLLRNFTEPVIIPIPLSKKRSRERGFNQAELISSEIFRIGRVAGEKFYLNTGILIKPRDTEHQARIRDRRERLRNIAGSFEVRDERAARGRNIILIDDILTTGATLSEARKALKRAGARHIIAFTVAH